MANYKDIKGFHVQSLSTDPAASQAAGGSWASGTAVNTARTSVMSTKSGTQSAYVIMGGTPPSGPPQRSILTESWNGSAWTEVNELNTGRSDGSCVGTQTAGLTAGGGIAPTPPNNTNITETWDGTNRK